MTLIVDSSFLVAMFNRGDKYFARARRFSLLRSELMLVPHVALPEISYLLTRDLDYLKSWRFLDFFEVANAKLQPIIADDLTRITEIANQYPRAEFDFVDLCIMAIAERLGITRIATFDGRDFSIYRPRHCDYFELLP